MSKPHYYKNSLEAGMVPIPRESLHTMIGKPIHLSWARNGARWILKAIDGDRINLETERTHRTRVDYAKNACYVRRYES